MVLANNLSEQSDRLAPPHTYEASAYNKNTETERPASGAAPWPGPFIANGLLWRRSLHSNVRCDPHGLGPQCRNLQPSWYYFNLNPTLC